MATEFYKALQIRNTLRKQEAETGAKFIQKVHIDKVNKKGHSACVTFMPNTPKSNKAVIAIEELARGVQAQQWYIENVSALRDWK